VVHNPAPIASTSGEIELTPGFVAQLPAGAASAALRQTVASAPYRLHWQHSSGYYEHSFGLQPLPLHSWDFLFAPDARQQQGLVLQTYGRSRDLRYIDLFWLEDGVQRTTRFGADQLTLTWHDVRMVPEIGVALPGRRTITAKKEGLRLEVDNQITHQIPLLRPEKLAVRHFFISEQIGFCSWQLTSSSGRTLAAAHHLPAGGEIAHARWRTGQPTSPSVERSTANAAV
jgi:hypothetical protein